MTDRKLTTLLTSQRIESVTIDHSSDNQFILSLGFTPSEFIQLNVD